MTRTRRISGRSGVTFKKAEQRRPFSAGDSPSRARRRMPRLTLVNRRTCCTLAFALDGRRTCSHLGKSQRHYDSNCSINECLTNFFRETRVHKFRTNFHVRFSHENRAKLMDYWFLQEDILFSNEALIFFQSLTFNRGEFIRERAKIGNCRTDKNASSNTAAEVHARDRRELTILIAFFPLWFIDGTMWGSFLRASIIIRASERGDFTSDLLHTR